MNKNDVLEIKRRYKKESQNFTRIAGCYVDSEKQKVLSFSYRPLELDDEEFFKYLDIAGKSLSGRLGNNILQLPFTDEAIEGGRTYGLLNELRATGLKDETVLEEFYDEVIEGYSIAGNFLIVLFHDVYDIPLKTKDEMDLGDSEDVFEYVLCAICPVVLSKSALGYRDDENRIGALLRSWTVSPVESAFMFPSFSERNADVGSVTVYTKNAASPHRELWEDCLKAASRLTSVEKKSAFDQIVGKSLGSDQDVDKESAFNIADSISGFIEKKKEEYPQDETVLVDGSDVENICKSAGVPEPKAARIGERFDDFFTGADEAVAADDLLDKRLLKDQELYHEKAALQREVASLHQQLDEAGASSDDDTSIYLKVPEEIAGDVTTAFVDGQRCLVIPTAYIERAMINGEERDLGRT